MRELIIIDGSMYMYRSYYSIPSQLNSFGIHTNAIVGFIRAIGYILVKNIDMVVVFDSRSNFRNDIYPEYKNNRKAMDEALREQFDLAYEYMQDADLPYIRIDGYEADDIIASIAKQYYQDYDAIYIYSSDKDFMQILNDKVSIVNTVKDLTIRYSEFCNEHKLQPEQYIDVQALAGDSSDNVPGVHGVGIKTALKLIQEYHSLEQLFENIDCIKQKSLKNKLMIDKENAFLSRQLVTLKNDLDITLDFSYTLNIESVISFFQKYQLQSMLSLYTKLSIIKNTCITEYIPSKYFGRGSNYIFNTDNNHNEYDDLSVMLFVASGEKYEEDFYNSYSHAYSQIRQKLYKSCQTKLYYDIDRPISYILHIMTTQGICIDLEALIKYKDSITQENNAIEKQIFDIIGSEFLISSALQTKNALSDYLGIDLKSTDANTLNRLNIDVAYLIVQWRSNSKILNDQINACINMNVHGVLYPKYHQDIVSTGRISASKPNIHNIPRNMRNIIVSSNPASRALVRFDYSQLELRIAASLSNDTSMIQAFKDNLDIHQESASKIFNVNIELVTPEMRQRAKAINFGILYGMSSFGILKRGYFDELKQAELYLTSYFDIYPGIKQYMDDTKKFWQEHGFVKNAFGRKIFTVRNYRSAINSPIQATAADILKSSMIAIYDMIRDRDDVKMVIQIHDELVFDIDFNSMNIINKIQHIMENPPIFHDEHALQVPMSVNVNITK